MGYGMAVGTESLFIAMHMHIKGVWISDPSLEGTRLSKVTVSQTSQTSQKRTSEVF